MLKPRRRTALVITAFAATVSSLALAVPAQAVVVPPPWQIGHIPSGPGCTMSGSFNVGSVFDQHWVDSSTPVVSDVFLNGGTTLVVPPGGATMTVSARVLAPCSGAGSAQEILLHNETTYTAPVMSPTTTDVFSGLWSESHAVTTADVGNYRMGEMNVARRYDSFILDSAFTYTSSVAGTSSAYVSGPWSLKKLYVLRATTLSNALSATKAAKGKTIKATAQLKMANGAVYAADAGAKVAVQTKVGTGKWVTNATLTANASGVVTFSFVLSATTSVRFVHAGTKSGNFTNGVISPIKVVTKI